MCQNRLIGPEETGREAACAAPQASGSARPTEAGYSAQVMLGLLPRNVHAEAA